MARKVLISYPPYAEKIYLPYIAGVLKLHCQRDPQLRAHYDWLDPIYLPGTPETWLRDYNLKEIDVLGLSCVVWNFQANLEIARRVKAVNPQCLVVAGGPEVDHRDPDFFRKHPEVDIAVIQDGEIPFAQILSERLKPEPQYLGISGLRINQRGASVATGAAQKILEFDELSPYVDTDVFQKLMDRRGREAFFKVLWETNRGCPYQCSFCDWGVNTGSRVRMIPEARLRRELDWFRQQRANVIFIKDANFGMFERDVQITREILQRAQSDWGLEELYWASAKNHPQRVYEITKMLHQGQLLHSLIVGLQSLNQPVLDVMKRDRSSSARQTRLVEQMVKENIPLTGVLIVGNPGESLEQFKDSITAMLDSGFHEEIHCNLYLVLPNAPAAQPAYRERHRFQTIRRTILTQRAPKHVVERNQNGQAEYLIGHSSLTPQDWIEEVVYMALVVALHNFGLTRFSAQYLRSHGLSYRAFYDLIFQAFASRPNTVLGLQIERLRHHLQRFISEPGAVYLLDLDIDEMLYEPEEFLYFHMMRNYERFSHELKSFFLQLDEGELFGREIDSGERARFVDLLDYQHQICISPQYDRRRGKVFHTGYNWPMYFGERLFEKSPEAEKDAASASHSLLKNPAAWRIQACDQSKGHSIYRRDLDWHERSERGQEDLYLGFARRVVYYRYLRDGAGHFTDLRIEATS